MSSLGQNLSLRRYGIKSYLYTHFLRILLSGPSSTNLAPLPGEGPNRL